METGITHFTSQTAAAAILEGWREALSRGKGNGDPEIDVRLYSRLGTNDPQDHKMAEYGKDVTEEKHPKGAPPRSRSTFPDDVFMMCGSKPQRGETGEVTNRLEMWRAYGDDGRGVAFTTWWDVETLRDEGLEIVTVEYLDDLSAVHREMDELLAQQSDPNTTRAQRQEVRLSRLRLGASHKQRDYASEQEVRLVYFRGDESGSVVGQIHFEARRGRLRVYVNMPVRLRTALVRVDVTLGPRMATSDAKHWEKAAQWMLAQMGLSGGRVEQSELEYIG